MLFCELGVCFFEMWFNGDKYNVIVLVLFLMLVGGFDRMVVDLDIVCFGGLVYGVFFVDMIVCVLWLWYFFCRLVYLFDIVCSVFMSVYECVICGGSIL